jgi:hypothetical protein
MPKCFFSLLPARCYENRVDTKIVIDPVILPSTNLYRQEQDNPAVEIILRDTPWSA